MSGSDVVDHAFFGDARYRFSGSSFETRYPFAVDQADAFAWIPHDSTPMQFMGLYKRSGATCSPPPLEVLRRVDNTT